MTTGLFVGRFQPFHRGHLAALKFALRKADHIAIVIGSAQKSYEPSNPFTAGERIRMIEESVHADEEIDPRRVLIIPVPDVDVHFLWTRYVDMLVPKYDLVFTNNTFTSTLFKDSGRKVIEPPLLRRSEFSATEIRKRIVDKNRAWDKLVTPQVVSIINEIKGLDRIRMLAGGAQHGHT